jgi:diaminohydroxyphosphoribosylaminopyrimidine deaminase/5-amino-6-(5-phosphoribosylamino)uracil reductase
MQHGTGTESDDERFMRRALELAGRAYGMTAPNPHVGAVVVRHGEILGEGFHQQAGLAHAEPQALQQAAGKIPFSSHGTRDLTLYVNVEPCIHQGRTPPCVDAILRAPVGRVVTAMVDPDRRVAGRGIDALRQRGIRVDVGCLEAEAEELNHAFVARQRRDRPFVALKVALSADDCIADADGAPARITAEAARRHAHRVRSGCQAILIGVETLARDHPRLDRRLYDGPGQVPRRLVFDPHLRSQPDWLRPGGEPWILCCAESAAGSPAARRLAGVAEIATLPTGPGGFDLGAFPEWLQERQLWSVLVEGGDRTHGAFLQAGLWDRFYVYRNRRLTLQGRPWSARGEWERQAAGALLRRRETLGNDDLVVFDHRDSVLAGLSRAR